MQPVALDESDSERSGIAGSGDRSIERERDRAVGKERAIRGCRLIVGDDDRVVSEGGRRSGHDDSGQSQSSDVLHGIMLSPTRLGCLIRESIGSDSSPGDSSGGSDSVLL